MKSALQILLPFILFTFAGSLMGATIELSNTSPKVGESITITFDVPVDTLTITYRPSSSVVKTEILVNDPPTTSLEWASKNPGLVNLSYLDRTEQLPVSRNVSVRFDGLSVSGLGVMIFAGFILFGGAGFAFRTLFRDQDEDGTLDFNPEELPDT